MARQKDLIRFARHAEHGAFSHFGLEGNLDADPSPP
jgi:hypothetical protein